MKPIINLRYNKKLECLIYNNNKNVHRLQINRNGLHKKLNKQVLKKSVESGRT